MTVQGGAWGQAGLQRLQGGPQGGGGGPACRGHPQRVGHPQAPPDPGWCVGCWCRGLARFVAGGAWPPRPAAPPTRPAPARQPAPPPAQPRHTAGRLVPYISLEICRPSAGMPQPDIQFTVSQLCGDTQKLLGVSQVIYNFFWRYRCDTQNYLGDAHVIHKNSRCGTQFHFKWSKENRIELLTSWPGCSQNFFGLKTLRISGESTNCSS